MSDRPKQSTPAEMVARLLAIVRSQFCGDMTGEEWGKHSHFVKRKVIMWPAHFVCNVKGFTLPADRYEKIMRTVFEDIKKHGATGAVRYWPGYLMKCVQDHWHHNWEQYYQDAKSARNVAETALMVLGKLPEKPDETVEAIAGAHGILSQKTRHKRIVAQQERSLPGF